MARSMNALMLTRTREEVKGEKLRSAPRTEEGKAAKRNEIYGNRNSGALSITILNIEVVVFDDLLLRIFFSLENRGRSTRFSFVRIVQNIFIGWYHDFFAFCQRIPSVFKNYICVTV